MECASFPDGRPFDIGLQPRWNPSPHVQVGFDYFLNVVRFPERDQGLDSHIARLRLRTALDTRLSLGIFTQYSALSDLISSNVRLHYNFSEGNDLWIVYDEGLNMERDRVVPSLPVSERRTVLLKYTHTPGK